MPPLHIRLFSALLASATLACSTISNAESNSPLDNLNIYSAFILLGAEFECMTNTPSIDIN